MAKYIDLDVAIARLTHLEVTTPTATMTAAKRALADMFPADVVPVVRCAECQYGDWDSKTDDALVCRKTNDGHWRSGKDFCSFGKRKDDAT